MRLLAVASVLSVLVAAATFACSSSDPVTPAADAGKDAKASQPTTDDDDTNADPDSGDTTPVTDPDAGGSDADAGPGTGGTLTMTGDGGTKCGDDSYREAETNNTEGSANQLPVKEGDTSVCGVVTADDPDFFTFKMPGDPTDQINYNVDPTGGQTIKFSGSIGGKPFDDFDFPNGIQGGDTWVVKISTGSTTPRNYHITFSFEVK